MLSFYYHRLLVFSICVIVYIYANFIEGGLLVDLLMLDLYFRYLPELITRSVGILDLEILLSFFKPRNGFGVNKKSNSFEGLREVVWVGVKLFF